MSLYETFFAAFISLVVLITAATLFGSWLEARTIDAVKLAWVHELNLRIRASWGIVVLFAIAFAVGGGGVLLIFALASFLALREFVALTPIKASDNWALVIAFYLVVPLQYALTATDWYGLYAVFVPVYVFLLLPVVIALKQDTERYLERVAKVQWGLMICVYCVSHAPAIALLELPGHEGRNSLLLLYFLLVLQLSELFAVIVSAAVGRTPLKSDPDKSREGVLLGGLGAVLVGTLLWWMTPFKWWQSLLMSVAIVCAGFMGALVLASVKRSLGARDWLDDSGHLIRGVLERLAPLTFAAPVFFHLTWVFFS